MTDKLSRKEIALLLGTLALVLFILGAVVWSIVHQDGRQKLPQFDLLRFDCGTYEYVKGAAYTNAVVKRNLPQPISEHDLGSEAGTITKENLYDAGSEWIGRTVWQRSGCNDSSVLIVETDDGYQYLFKTLD